MGIDVTYPPPYACMDPMNRVKSYAAARCKTCGCATDLRYIGMEFFCRGMHHYKDWDRILDQMVEIAEPAA
jgi:hypothetical protein